MPDQVFTIASVAGRFTVDVYADGNIWLTHPTTGVRIGTGQLENEERQPFAHVNTETSTEPEIGSEPVIHIALNDADLYDVERIGPTPDSAYHRSAS